MFSNKSAGAVLALLSVAFAAPVNAQSKPVDVTAFTKTEQFDAVKISPNGDYLAASMPLEDRSALVILRRSDRKVTASVQFGENEFIRNFHWVNDGRVVLSMAWKDGSADQPFATGELYGIDADGGKAQKLIGQTVQGTATGTRVQYVKTEQVAAYVLDPLASDDKQILVQTEYFNADPIPQYELLNVYTGQRKLLGKSPVTNASFTVDPQGVVRFASGEGKDGVMRLFYRAGADAEWTLINDASVSGHEEYPLGFTEDGKTAYLQVEHEQGPDSIVAMDVASNARKQILRDAVADPSGVIFRNDSQVPIGVTFEHGKPRKEFFDAALPEAKLYRSLEKAFGGEVPVITSSTSDGNLALVATYSDRNPGDYFIFDRAAKKADHMMSRRQWLVPATLAPMQPISLKSRDGLALHGYFTAPLGSTGKNLPVVVLPHGGPFGIHDTWAFNEEVQMLAAAGYGVLQVNFRGSGGYGQAFASAGARQWGGKMQDDLTDATRWAIEEGMADASRICIYGASYGAYAALMGAAREPSLYRCAVGYIGVYELPLMHKKGDIQTRSSGEAYLNTWLGPASEVAAISPTRLADRIKVPVFLAAGGQDQRAPIAHTGMMENALKKAGVPVETLYYDKEGHGFYVEAHRTEYYTRLLAFLGKHLGGSPAAAAATAK